MLSAGTQRLRTLEIPCCKLGDDSHKSTSHLFTPSDISITQPSNLWRLRARAYQNGDDWKILAHIRYCAKILEDSGKLEPFITGLAAFSMTPDAAVDSAALYENVVANLTGWRHWEIGEINESTMLQRIYDVDRKALPQPVSIPASRCYTLKSDRLTVRLLDTPESCNTLTVTDVLTTITEKSSNGPTVCDTVTFVVIIGGFELDLKPDVVTLAPVLARIQTESASAQSEVRSLSSKVVRQARIFGTVNVDRVAATIASTADVAVHSELFNIYYATASSAHDASELSDNGNSVTATKLPALPNALLSHAVALERGRFWFGGNECNSLATISLDNIQASIVIGHPMVSAGADTRTIDVLVKCGGVNINLPRPLLQVYSVYEENKEDFLRYLALFEEQVKNTEEVLRRSQQSLRAAKQSMSLSLQIDMLALAMTVMPTLSVRYGCFGNTVHMAWSDRDSGMARYLLNIQHQLLSLVATDGNGSGHASNFALPVMTVYAATSGGKEVDRSLCTVTLAPMKSTLEVTMLEKAFTAIALVKDDLDSLADLYVFKQEARSTKKRDREVQSDAAPMLLSFRVILSRIGLLVTTPDGGVSVDIRPFNLVLTNCPGLAKDFAGAQSVAASSSLSWTIGSPYVSASCSRRLQHDRLERVAQVSLNFAATSVVTVDEQARTISVAINQVLGIAHPLALSILQHGFSFVLGDISRRRLARSGEIDSLKRQAERVLQLHGMTARGYSQRVLQKAKAARIVVRLRKADLALNLGPTSALSRGLSSSKVPALLCRIDAADALYGDDQSWVLDSKMASMCYEEDFATLDLLNVVGAAAHASANALHVPDIVAKIMVSPGSDESIMVSVDVGRLLLTVNSRIALAISALRDTETFISQSPSNSAEALSTVASIGYTLTFTVDGIDLHLTPLGLASSGRRNVSLQQKFKTMSKAKNGKLTAVALHDDTQTLYVGLPNVIVQSSFSMIDGGQLVDIFVAPVVNTFVPAVVPVMMCFGAEFSVLLRRAVSKSASYMPRMTTTPSASAFSLSVYCPSIKIIFSCQPSSKVETVLTLTELELLVTDTTTTTTSALDHRLPFSDSHLWNITGVLENVKLQLRHEFAPEECLLILLKNVAVAYSLVRESHHDAHAWTVNLPELSGLHTIRHLQDLLIFYDTWFVTARQQAGKQATGVASEFSLDAPSSSRATTPSVAAASPTSTRPRSTYAMLRIGKIAFTADLTQAIGKVLINAENIGAKLSAVEDMTRTCFATVGLLEVRSSGRLNGVLAGLVNARFSFSNVDPFKMNGGVPDRTLTLGCLVADRLLTQLEFNFDPIAVLDISPFYLRITDVWREFSATVVRIHIGVDMRIDRVTGILSKNSVPHVLRLIAKLRAIVFERMKAVPRSSGFIPEDISSSVDAAPLKAGGFSHWAAPVNVSTKLSVLIGDVNVALFKERFDPNQGEVCIECVLYDRLI